MDEYEYSEYEGSSRKPWGQTIGKLLVVSLGLLLLAGGAVGGYVAITQANSPQHAAEEWFDSIWAMDNLATLDRTCNDQLWVANLISSGNSVSGFVDFLGITSIPGLPTGDIDIEKLRGQFEVDASYLEYGEEQVGETTAVVTVFGQIRFRVFRGWYAFPVEEKWTMVKELDDWKWCGRE